MSKIVLNGESFDLRGPAGPDGNPIGTIISFMGLKAPKDYLICDGSTYNISDYHNLAAFFKEQFGSETYFGNNGDGTFAVPDMRNLFLRGYHGEADGQLSGEVGQKQEATIHPYIRTMSDLIGPVSQTIIYPDYVAPPINQSCGSSIGKVTTGISSNYTSRPVNMAVLYCIKAVKSESEIRADGEIYSTEETRIGTWIDGKPLYRKAFKATLFNKQSSGDALLSLEASAVATNIYGFAISSSGAHFMIPLIDFDLTNNSLTHAIIPYYTTSVGSPIIAARIYGKDGRFYNAAATFIVEYTKTTDNATTVISAVAPKASGTITQDGTQPSSRISE